ncbi:MULTISPECIES: alpha-ketoacid dehydrogenase subunit beta [unclassified Nonomuraea]|uniref:alpha-ketoacid dehydrogenase subunit beta n=1 Tax=unclassified Nonomuraea TaxID=2593643 RepID=UPI001486000C|nr:MULTISPECIES: transketolase C-terminal domain-containing protein [unclassified Nonomuraea]
MPDRELTYGEAVNAALHRLMEELPETLVYGEDVGVPGGVFGVTRGLRKRYGDRVFDTPISESAILGSAVGAAMMGRRPIVEIMWADFSLVALDQIVNQAANVRYVSGGRLSAPLTIRTQQGGAPGACAQHSQCLEALFLHVPGLRVCMPSTPQDAYDLLVTAVHGDDPTLVIENRTLYAGAKERVRTGGPVAPMGGARTRRTGSDVTIVTWGAMTHRVLEAAGTLAGQGMHAEVVETPWLNPFDTGAVLESIRRTGRLAVVHEANLTGGFGAEVVARVAGAGVPLLAPPLRIGTPDVRMPAAPTLAQALVPGAGRIADEVRALVRQEAPR